MTKSYNHISRNNKNYKENNEYYTPQWVFQQLNIKFDLDVCAPEGGVPWIPAENHYYESLDGLAQPWYGKVWCNPPYSAPSLWVDKFIEHNNGVCLLFFSKAIWFEKLWQQANSIVLLPRQFKFEHKDHGTKGVFMPVFLASMGEYCTDYLERSGIGRAR